MHDHAPRQSTCGRPSQSDGIAHTGSSGFTGIHEDFFSPLRTTIMNSIEEIPINERNVLELIFILPPQWKKFSTGRGFCKSQAKQ
jgi:hypothetical protein